jgi:hypothetical protein
MGMSPVMITLLSSVLVAAITGGLSYLGVVYKTNKEEKVRDIKAEASFNLITQEIKNSADMQAQKSDFIVKEIKGDIKRLEEKQEKYNNLQERTLANTMKIDALHQRMDSFEDNQ